MVRWHVKLEKFMVLIVAVIVVAHLIIIQMLVRMDRTSGCYYDLGHLLNRVVYKSQMRIQTKTTINVKILKKIEQLNK